MDKNSSQTMAPLSRDLGSAFLLGAMASLFASIVAKNLDFLGNSYGGITLSIPLIFILFIVLCISGIIVARLFKGRIPVLYKFGKFGETGGLNWLVDLGVMNLLIMITGIAGGIYFAIFKAVSFAAAATNSFFWNKYWVFSGAKKQKESQEVGKFALATLMGMALNVAVAYCIATFAPDIFSGISEKSWANIATIIGSLTGMMFNFVVYKIWVFKN